MLTVDKHCCDVCCDEFPVPQIDRKSKQVKEQWHGKFYLQSVSRKTRYFKHWKYRNLWTNNKGRGDKNATCLHLLPYVLNICRKLAFLISQGSVVTCLRWGGYCRTGSVANFIHFPIVQKFCKSVKIWQSYREFKGGNFFEIQCRRPSVERMPSPRLTMCSYLLSSTFTMWRLPIVHGPHATL